MKSVITMIIFLALSFTVLAQQDCKDTVQQNTIDKLIFNANPINERGPASLIKDQQPKEFQRGCCSWHGGVCGCSYGNVVCCDGQFSPSCGC